MKKSAKHDKRHDVALRRIQRIFPKVTEITDATAPLLVNVTEADCKGAVKSDPEHCAMAVAVRRQKVADGAIIGVAYSWLIRGTKAIRFRTSETVGREITSFDRHDDFAAGVNYRLGPISPANRLGAGKVHKGSHNSHTTPLTQKVHRTARIRELWPREKF